MARYALDFDWCGFELHPEIPAGGMDLSTMFPPEMVKGMHARLQQVADDLGVTIRPQARAPSTKPALVLSAYARTHGALDAFREHTMDAYWRDGLDIEDRGVLRQLCIKSGLDPDDAMGFLDGEQAPHILLAQRREAMQWGVTGIPTWFMLPTGWSPEGAGPDDDDDDDGPRPVRVVGCQPLDVVEQAAQMAGARLRTPD